jgi:uncharacterized protein YbbC (DUF1343 family)/CubicO group peptidase (beta-lactamase class C family)
MSISTYFSKRYFRLVYLLVFIYAEGLPHQLTAQQISTSENSAAKQKRNFSAIDAIMQQAVDDGNIPGGVVLIGHDGHIVYRKAFGSRSIEPQRESMTLDTVFDVASLTKCIVTATAVMQLIESGQVRLNDPVATYLPQFAQNGKGQITVRELLTHFSGLPADLDLKQSWKSKATAFDLAMQTKIAYTPGSHYLYSDINFEVLGFLVEKVSGLALNDYAHNYIFAPIGMDDTTFLPPSTWMGRIAPTQYDDDGNMLRGIVHDPTARRMGGVAGHAGLFSTADDLAKYAEALLSGDKILSQSSIKKMTTPQQPATASNLRGLGWDIDSPFSSNRGELLPIGSFGHTGFTGTSLWIDPSTNSYIVLLTNAVHPRGGKSTLSLRSRVATAAVQTLDLSVDEREKLRLSLITGYNETLTSERRLSYRNGDIKSGIDVLEEHNFRELHTDPAHPLRVGLVTNQTGIDSHGQRTADLIAQTPGLKLVAIFSPEHGIAGNLDTTVIGDSYDPATGTTVYSVYGDSDIQRRPKEAQIGSLDVIIYDIQDAGVRCYTYESTLGYFLEAAAKADKEIIVLDRPNPINGSYVQGPITDIGREAFVSYWRTPLRHGMTVGELARMFNSERSINAKLTIIPMHGWMRGDWFDSTGKVWVNPSPNLRNLDEATLYPGIGMIEGANISVGRGTDTPFELVGAPWIDATSLAAYLNSREIDGVRFVPVSFTPNASIYAKERCGGINIIVTNRDALDAPELGLEVAAALQYLYPDKINIKSIDGIVRNKMTIDALQAGEDPRRIAEDWQDTINDFMAIRAMYLLY